MASPLPLPKYLREEFLSQECKDLLPTLPSEEEGWNGFRIYFYQGFWFIPTHLNGILFSRSNFRAHDNDIILTTLPKSGTTWLKAMLFALSRRFMGEDSLLQPNPLLTTSPHELVPYLELNLLDENRNPDLSSFTSMRIFSTHMPYVLLPKSIRDSKCKIVYLCRNPKDNFASLWHFTKTLPEEIGEISLEEEFDKFCRGVSPFGPYWDHVLGYWMAGLEFPERVLFLKYEDMKERPVEMVKRLAEFIGCPIEEDGEANEILSMCSFETLSKLEVNKNGMSPFGVKNNVFFRKGDVGDWRNLLSPEMANRLDSITEEKLRGFGLKL